MLKMPMIGRVFRPEVRASTAERIAARILWEENVRFKSPLILLSYAHPFLCRSWELSPCVVFSPWPV